MHESERQSRQGFLGARALPAFRDVIVGIVGLGGGGSHISQQLAHIGFVNLRLFDGDMVEESNLNRLVGATMEDASHGVSKVDVAERLIHGISPGAQVETFSGNWQHSFQALRQCHVIFGCLDSFAGREELERFARRYLVAYIDIGMDVVIGGDGIPVVGGQVILSLPGQPCMRCLGYLTDDLLTREAQRYGDAGIRPQVIWMNGVLASTAVGVCVDLLTDWTGRLRGPLYLEYDGRKGTLKSRLPIELPVCMHCLDSEIGEPVLRLLA